MKFSDYKYRMQKYLQRLHEKTLILQNQGLSFKVHFLINNPSISRFVSEVQKS